MSVDFGASVDVAGTINGFDKDKTDVMFGLTLYDFASFISLYVQVKV